MIKKLTICENETPWKELTQEVLDNFGQVELKTFTVRIISSHNDDVEWSVLWIIAWSI